MSIEGSHYYRQVWYWGGEADLRVNGKKMKFTSLPANEWQGDLKILKLSDMKLLKLVLVWLKLLMHINYMQPLWIKQDILTDNKILLHSGIRARVI